MISKLYLFADYFSKKNQEEVAKILERLNNDTKENKIIFCISMRILQLLDKDGFDIISSDKSIGGRNLTTKWNLEALQDFSILKGVNVEEELMELLAHQIFNELKSISNDSKKIEIFYVYTQTKIIDENFQHLLVLSSDLRFI